MKKHIPNIITLFNMFSGLIAVICVANSNYKEAFFFVCLGIFFDFFDGFFARLLKVQSNLGLQLDSMADMVTSGVVPGYVMYQILKTTVPTLFTSALLIEYLPYLGFLITLASGYRLAKFNIDERQTSGFIGLNTPSNALFICSFPLIIETTKCSGSFCFLSNPMFYLSITMFSAYIMNCELPLFSLKLKQDNKKGIYFTVGFLTLCIILLVILKIIAVPIIILLYIFTSPLYNKLTKK